MAPQLGPRARARQVRRDESSSRRPGGRNQADLVRQVEGEEEAFSYSQRGGGRWQPRWLRRWHDNTSEDVGADVATQVPWSEETDYSDSHNNDDDEEASENERKQISIIIGRSPTRRARVVPGAGGRGLRPTYGMSASANTTPTRRHWRAPPSLRPAAGQQNYRAPDYGDDYEHQYYYGHEQRRRGAAYGGERDNELGLDWTGAGRGRARAFSGGGGGEAHSRGASPLWQSDNFLVGTQAKTTTITTSDVSNHRHKQHGRATPQMLSRRSTISVSSQEAEQQWPRAQAGAELAPVLSHNGRSQVRRRPTGPFEASAPSSGGTTTTTTFATAAGGASAAALVATPPQPPQPAGPSPASDCQPPKGSSAPTFMATGANGTTASASHCPAHTQTQTQTPAAATTTTPPSIADAKPSEPPPKNPPPAQK